MYDKISPDGRYVRQGKILGQGSFKIVYLAYDQFSAMEVAWSVIKLPSHVDMNLVRSINSEVSILTRLNHPNIIKLLMWWYCKEDMNFHMITEIFFPGNLRSYTRKYHPISRPAIVAWLRQIVKGIVYLHGQDPPVIHRDLKCDNIFLNSNTGVLKIGDLGLAIARSSVRHSTGVVGTPEFMSPETYDGRYDCATDIYAFGMVMLELATSELPYAECKNFIEIYQKVSAGIIPLSLVRVVPGKYKRLILRCIGPAHARPAAAEILDDPFFVDPDEEWDRDKKLPSSRITERVAGKKVNFGIIYMLGRKFEDGATERVKKAWADVLVVDDGVHKAPSRDASNDASPGDKGDLPRAPDAADNTAAQK